MLKLGKQILHTLVLLITGMALIGVNVTQSGCIHSDRTYLEVRVLPAENTCPCEEGCGCCQEERQFCKDCCHASSRHDFYKVTDSSLVERVLQMQLSVFTLPECGWEMTKGWLCFLPEVSRDSALIGIVVYFSLLKPFAGQS